eukprot:TRINITY_DN9997_c0_g1_i3.p1 TRINITY_DN9997_c0_g1~~TRINITY_DN9997_c0_g1_i3.p1  ORF type:complete len:1719 (+),score=449.22 TRINITY_DN9997_c0_g1_i3:1585-6741(+)
MLRQGAAEHASPPTPHTASPLSQASASPTLVRAVSSRRVRLSGSPSTSAFDPRPTPPPPGAASKRKRRRPPELPGAGLPMSPVDVVELPHALARKSPPVASEAPADVASGTIDAPPPPVAPAAPSLKRVRSLRRRRRRGPKEKSADSARDAPHSPLSEASLHEEQVEAGDQDVGRDGAQEPAEDAPAALGFEFSGLLEAPEEADGAAAATPASLSSSSSSGSTSASTDTLGPDVLAVAAQAAALEMSFRPAAVEEEPADGAPPAAPRRRRKRRRRVRRASVKAGPPKPDRWGFCPVQSLAEKQLYGSRKVNVKVPEFSSKAHRHLALKPNDDRRFRWARRHGRADRSSSEEEGGEGAAAAAAAPQKRKGKVDTNLRMTEFNLMRYGPTVVQHWGEQGDDYGGGDSALSPTTLAASASDQEAAPPEAGSGAPAAAEAGGTGMFTHIIARFEALAGDEDQDSCLAGKAKKKKKKQKQNKAKAKKKAKPVLDDKPPSAPPGTPRTEGFPPPSPPPQVVLIKPRSKQAFWQVQLQELQEELDAQHARELAAAEEAEEEEDEEGEESSAEDNGDWGVHVEPTDVPGTPITPPEALLKSGGASFETAVPGAARAPRTVRKKPQTALKSPTQVNGNEGRVLSAGQPASALRPSTGPQLINAAPPRPLPGGAGGGGRSSQSLLRASHSPPVPSPLLRPSQSKRGLRKGASEGSFRHVPSSPELKRLRKGASEGSFRHVPSSPELKRLRKGASEGSFRHVPSSPELKRLRKGASEGSFRHVPSSPELKRLRKGASEGSSSPELKAGNRGTAAAAGEEPAELRRMVSFALPVVLEPLSGDERGKERVGSDGSDREDEDEDDDEENDSSSDDAWVSIERAMVDLPHDVVLSPTASAASDQQPASPAFELAAVGEKTLRDKRRKWRGGDDSESCMSSEPRQSMASMSDKSDIDFERLRAVVDQNATVGFDGTAVEASSPTARPVFTGIASRALLGNLVGAEDGSGPNSPVSLSPKQGSPVWESVGAVARMASRIHGLRKKRHAGAGTPNTPMAHSPALATSAESPPPSPPPLSPVSPRPRPQRAMTSANLSRQAERPASAALSRVASVVLRMKKRGGGRAHIESPVSERPPQTPPPTITSAGGTFRKIAGVVMRAKTIRDFGKKGGKGAQAAAAAPAPLADISEVASVGSAAASCEEGGYTPLGVRDLPSFWAGMRRPPPPLRAGHFCGAEAEEEEEDCAATSVPPAPKHSHYRIRNRNRNFKRTAAEEDLSESASSLSPSSVSLGVDTQPRLLTAATTVMRTVSFAKRATPPARLPSPTESERSAPPSPNPASPRSLLGTPASSRKPPSPNRPPRAPEMLQLVPAGPAFPEGSLEQLSRMAGDADLDVEFVNHAHSRGRTPDGVPSRSSSAALSRATSPGFGSGRFTPDAAGSRRFSAWRRRRSSMSLHHPAHRRRPSSDMTGSMTEGRRKSELESRRRSSAKVTILGPRTKRPSIYDEMRVERGLREPSPDEAPYSGAGSPLSKDGTVHAAYESLHAEDAVTEVLPGSPATPQLRGFAEEQHPQQPAPRRAAGAPLYALPDDDGSSAHDREVEAVLSRPSVASTPGDLSGAAADKAGEAAVRPVPPARGSVSSGPPTRERRKGCKSPKEREAKGSWRPLLGRFSSSSARSLCSQGRAGTPTPSERPASSLSVIPTAPVVGCDESEPSPTCDGGVSLDLEEDADGALVI